MDAEWFHETSLCKRFVPRLTLWDNCTLSRSMGYKS